MTNDKFFTYQQKIELDNAIYKKKIKSLQRRVKNFVYENAALCDQVAQIQENILCVKEERRFLLKKLIEHENDIDSSQPTLNLTNNNDFNLSGIKRQPKKRTISEANSENSGISGSVTKKLKASNKKIIPLDGIVLPINLTGFVVYSLGNIIYDRPNYHTKNLIFPVGFVSTRVYSHYKDAEKKCMYTCKILENGDTPKFEIIPESEPDFIITGSSTDFCHRQLLQYINSVTDMRNVNIRSQGDWFFGLADSTVMNLIQNLPNARKCINFKGFINENYLQDLENNPSLNYEALQKHIAIASYHKLPEVKEEPPLDLLEN